MSTGKLLRFSGLEATSERAGALDASPEGGSWRAQMRAGLAGLSYAEQMAAVAPPVPSRVVQRSEDENAVEGEEGGEFREVPVGELPPVVSSIRELFKDPAKHGVALEQVAAVFGFDPYAQWGFLPAVLEGERPGSGPDPIVLVTPAHEAALSAALENQQPWPQGRHPLMKLAPISLTQVRTYSFAGEVVTREQWSWMYTYCQLVALFVSLVAARRGAAEAGTEAVPDPNRGERNNIVSIALGEVGRVEAHTTVAQKVDGKMVKRRFGHERLLAYFETAFPAAKFAKLRAVLDDPSHTLADGLPSWCGIFSTWVLATAGLGAAEHSWPNPPFTANMMGTPSKGQWGLLAPDEAPLPGDVAYDPAKNNHYCVVVASNGTQVVTVDGNIDPLSNLMVMTRSRGDVKIARTFAAP